jgi:SAM-dependent methyltransferase
MRDETAGLNSSTASGREQRNALDSQLDKLYSNRFSEAERSAKAALWQVLCDGFFSRYIRTDATVLDVGAGYCEFINNVSAKRRIAVDLNPDLTRYAGRGVEALNASFTDLPTLLGSESVDVAFASNVFEHVRGPDALLQILRELRRTLKAGGLLIILQPNVRLVGGRFWDFFDHTLPLTERGMIEALHLSGYEIVECRPRFLPHTTKSRVPKWPFLLKVYLRLRPAQWLFGKQMLIVATPSS